MVQKGLYFDESRCTACETCVIACKDWHDVELGVHWLRVMTSESGKYPRVKVKYSLRVCRHCGKAPCMEVCPTEAITRREEDGVVLVDSEKCIGCRDCLPACPFGVPQFGEDGVLQKCNLCEARIQNGENPVCVDACPTRALFFGTIRELANIPYLKRRA
jgi:anaerobic dimethyl sulfoxide reductase subunit B (iron-sulfur subunit)